MRRCRDVGVVGVVGLSCFLAQAQPGSWGSVLWSDGLGLAAGQPGGEAG
jgi:hypothetical protein